MRRMLLTSNAGERRPVGRQGLGWIAILVALTAPCGAEWIRLSQGAAWSDVNGFVVSPNGRWVAYLQDAETDEAIEVWSVRLPAGAPVKLSGNLPANGFTGELGISPDSSRVVYLAQQDTAGVGELYSVPIGGPAGAAVKLNGALAPGGSVGSFHISPDSTRVVYAAPQNLGNQSELYSVPISGPASSGVEISQIAAGGYWTAGNFAISPDGLWVVYRALGDLILGGHELYSVPIAGPASSDVRLNVSLVLGGSVSSYQVSLDSTRVVFLAAVEMISNLELWSVPIAGPAGSGVLLDDDVVSQVQISPDSEWALFVRDIGKSLYSIPIAGPAAAAVKLNGALVAGGSVRGSAVSPDSSRAVYVADQQTDGVVEIYSVPIAGPAGAGIKLNRPLVNGGDVNTNAFRISPDSAWVVYAADQELDGLPTGHRAPLAGPAASDAQIWYSAYSANPAFEILADSKSVAVLGNHTFVDGIERIWTYPLAGTPVPQGTDWLFGELQPDGDCGLFKTLPGGIGAVYVADQEVDELLDVYVLYFRLWGDDFEIGDSSRWSAEMP